MGAWFYFRHSLALRVSTCPAGHFPGRVRGAAVFSARSLLPAQRPQLGVGSGDFLSLEAGPGRPACPGNHALSPGPGSAPPAPPSPSPRCRFEAELSPVGQKLSALRSPLAQRPFFEAPSPLGAVDLYEFACGDEDLEPL